MSRVGRTAVAPRFVLFALLAAAAIVVGVTGSHYLPSTTSKSTAAVTSKKDTSTASMPRPTSSPVSSGVPGTQFPTDPPPGLFDSKQLADASRLINAQQAAADRLIKSYWAGHGTDIDDAGFVAWVTRHLPSAPAPSQRSQEMATLATLKAARSSSGLAAARWLSRHSSTDLWPELRTGQTEFRSASEERSSESELRTATDLADTIARGVSHQASLPAPYVVDASIRDDQKVTAGATCPCSYPSQSAALGATATGYLSSLSPERRGEYRFIQSQVVAASLYRADAFPSDLSAGTYIGDVVSAYLLVTRGHSTP